MNNYKQTVFVNSSVVVLLYTLNKQLF